MEIPHHLLECKKDRRNRRVEGEAPPNVVRDLVDGRVCLARERSVAGIASRLVGMLHSRPPEAVEEANDPFEPRVLPFGVLLDRPDE